MKDEQMQQRGSCQLLPGTGNEPATPTQGDFDI